MSYSILPAMAFFASFSNSGLAKSGLSFLTALHLKKKTEHVLSSRLAGRSLFCQTVSHVRTRSNDTCSSSPQTHEVTGHSKTSSFAHTLFGSSSPSRYLGTKVVSLADPHRVALPRRSVHAEAETRGSSAGRRVRMSDVGAPPSRASERAFRRGIVASKRSE